MAVVQSFALPNLTKQVATTDPLATSSGPSLTPGPAKVPTGSGPVLTPGPPKSADPSAPPPSYVPPSTAPPPTFSTPPGFTLPYPNAKTPTTPGPTLPNTGPLRDPNAGPAFPGWDPSWGDVAQYSMDARNFMIAQPSPDLINPRNWAAMDDYSKQLNLASWKAKGYEPDQLTQKFAAELPQFHSPIFGLVT